MASGSNTYRVGQGQPYPTIVSVPLLTLEAGDWVCIYAHNSNTVYKEKFAINSAGTAAKPIVFSGVADPSSGKLPVIDGNGATTPQYMDYWNEERNVIKIGGGSKPAGPAQHIRVQHLNIKNGHENCKFMDYSGNSDQSYADNAACVQIEEGNHILLVSIEISFCGTGIFSGKVTSDVLIQGNYLHDNGVSGSAYEHNTYTSSLRNTYKENRFGPLCPTCTGNNFKDRSAGLVAQNNLIEGGNRQLDLVDGASFKDMPEYQSTHAFGNILVEFNGQGNRQMVHFGGDGGDMTAYRKNLYFYHNTIVLSKRTDKTRSCSCVGKDPRPTFTTTSSLPRTCRQALNYWPRTHWESSYPNSSG